MVDHFVSHLVDHRGRVDAADAKAVPVLGSERSAPGVIQV
jgi:hypothetical protein